LQYINYSCDIGGQLGEVGCVSWEWMVRQLVVCTKEEIKLHLPAEE